MWPLPSAPSCSVASFASNASNCVVNVLLASRNCWISSSSARFAATRAAKLEDWFPGRDDSEPVTEEGKIAVVRLL